MNVNLDSLLALTKILSEHNESGVKVEKKLLDKNCTENETRSRSYVVQLGSSNLILYKSKFEYSKYPEGEYPEFLNHFK